ncbi:MAG: hypothetical protein Q9224_007630, partial [Gallowayella concinna]
MKRLNNQIGHQMSNKIEDYGYMSSSSPSGHDPREQYPINEEEVKELQIAIWPSIQQVVELTQRYPNHSDTSKCYLDQFRTLHNQLQYIWQLQSHPSSAPALFQLEAWKGGIVNWRSSTYTNGDDRFPASIISDHLEIWRAEMPSPSPSPSFQDLHMPDIDESDLEMESLHPLRHHLDTSSPLHDPSSPLPAPTGHRRRVMSALYDRNRDIGFLPTPAQMQSYQAGTLSSTTLPFNSMSDPGIPIIDSTHSSSSNPIAEHYHIHGHHNIDIYEGGENVTPSDDGGAWEGYAASQASATSDKENDVQAMENVMEEQRREGMRTPSPSNSQDNIDPVEERR